MAGGALQPTLAWAEDRALLGSNPSADPGAKTGDGATLRRPTPFPHYSGIGTHAENPTRNPAATRHWSDSQFANAKGFEFQFTVNQDI